jgi:cell division protein FtsB
MEALSFVLSLSFFPPKESYSVVQDAEERREKGVTMNSILNSLFLRVLIGFFFSRVLKKQLFWHIKKARENTEREQKREKENSKKKNTNTRQEKEISLLFGRKMPLKITPFLSKHQRVLLRR